MVSSVHLGAVSVKQKILKQRKVGNTVYIENTISTPGVLKQNVDKIAMNRLERQVV